MAPQSEREQLLAAWRALGGGQGGQGWRAIPVAAGGRCRLLAGRRLPGDEEALLVGFNRIGLPRSDQLPRGRGFLVSHADLGDDLAWVAISREPLASLELFAVIASDLVSSLARIPGGDEDVLSVFVARIRAWQDFMHRSQDGVLSPDAETGLFGELEFVTDLLAAKIPPSVAIESWKGPIGGLNDFLLGVGAFEVKSTVAPDGFLVSIGSLQQLDDSVTHPLYLAAMRFTVGEVGRTLPEQANDIRAILVKHPMELSAFNTRLIHAGFLDIATDRYYRRFSRAESKFMYVSAAFPRLTHANVATQVKSARYELDLTLVDSPHVAIATALKHVGVV
jgi:hypothetical protein